MLAEQREQTQVNLGNVSGGFVACDQVQYPDALPTMLTDLRSIRQWAGYLQKTEIKFDMVSAVDELAKQVTCQHLAPECGKGHAARRFAFETEVTLRSMDLMGQLCGSRGSCTDP